jgi:hypothetical protein
VPENTEVTAPAGELNEPGSGYTPPASQADLDRIIQDYDDLKAAASQVETFQSRIGELEATNGELSGKIQSFEQEKERSALISKVAKEKGVPADALRGNTAEELEAHAALLAELIKPSGPVIPGQELAPDKIPNSPEREAARKLFGN